MVLLRGLRKRAMSPIVDETFKVWPAIRRPKIPPMRVVGMFSMMSNACQIDPKEEKRMTNMMRITISMSVARCLNALCWLSNCPPKVTK